MSRPCTLFSVAERLLDGVPLGIALPEFMDEFLAAETRDRKLAMLMDDPPSTGDIRSDALLGAVAEYLAKQNRLDRVPPWAGSALRMLKEPWFTTTVDSPGMREFLAWASPAEFRNHNIFTDQAPLSRARSRHS